MNFLITGHKGYIGPHLVELLKNEGHSITGVDVGFFSGCEWHKLPEVDNELNLDFRDLETKDLKGFDCVFHLAAISNDPMGDLNKELTYQINREGSIEFAKKVKEAGVPRFLFSGSCSIYGKGNKLDLDENSELNPVSAYAESKIAMESALWEMSGKDFVVASLRNSTAYGYSPNLRIDLVVNNLLACALALGEIRIMSDGSPWRPLVHCRDIARAFVEFSKAEPGLIQNQAVNIGANNENFQVKDVADYVIKLIPDAKISYTGEVGNDPRNYRVNFDKLYKLFPHFQLQYNLFDGMVELYNRYKEFGFSEKDFSGDQFVRLKILKKKLDEFGNLK